MKMNRILAVLLVVLMAVSCVAPAFAYSEPEVEPTNVFLDAYCVKVRNLFQINGTQFWNLGDGEIAPGPSFMQGSLTSKVQSFVWRYNTDGERDDTNGTYMWTIAYQLKKEATFSSLSLWSCDLIALNAVGGTIPWLLHDFDILVSDTGEAGSWTVAYSSGVTHNGTTAGAGYTFHAATDDRVASVEYHAEFPEVTASYVMIASTETWDTKRTSNSQYVDLTELELFGNYTEDAEEVVPTNNAMYKATPLEIKSLTAKNNSGASDLVNDMHAYAKFNQGNFTSQITNAASGPNRYNADGVMGNKNSSDEYKYLWYLSFMLRDTFTLDHFSLYFCDLAGAVGDPISWLFKDFDILVSETGKPGSWTVAYSASDLWSGSPATSTAYVHHDAEDVNHVAYYQYDGTFEKAVVANYVAIGTTQLTGSSGWFDMSEIDIFAVDKTELNKTIADATEFCEELTDAGLDDLADTLQDAIDTAQLVANNKTASQADVNEAQKTLKAALQTAKNEKEPASQQAAFENQKGLANLVLLVISMADESNQFQALIEEAMEAINNLEYDPSLTLDENIAAIEQILDDLIPVLKDQLAIDGKLDGIIPLGDVSGIPALTPWDVPWLTSEGAFGGSPWLAYYIAPGDTFMFYNDEMAENWNDNNPEPWYDWYYLFH